MLDSPEWLAVTEKAATLDPYVSLLDICICIPRILERSDRLASSDDLSQSLDQLLNDADQLAVVSKLAEGHCDLFHDEAIVHVQT